MRGQKRRREDRKSEEGGGAPGWMVTYGDLMSLLLTFFVLIVSFSSIQDSKFQKAMGSLKAHLGVLKFKPSPIQPSALKMHSLRGFKMSQKGNKDFEGLLNHVKANEFGDSVKIEVNENGVMIRFMDGILFQSGRADLKQAVYPLLAKVGEFAEDWPSRIRVEGHTDNVPINTPEFPSNWELSALRAIRVIHFFEKVSGIDPMKLYYRGYGENKPLAPNTTSESRAKNRRVEIYLERGEYPTENRVSLAND
jgi:chemotaxis protein MotB